eukprot:4674870-Pleurochrysis_carterae.AAC.1
MNILTTFILPEEHLMNRRVHSRPNARASRSPLRRSASTLANARTCSASSRVGTSTSTLAPSPGFVRRSCA